MGVLFALLSSLVFATNNVIIKKGSRGSKSNNGFLITVLMNVIILAIIFFSVLIIKLDTFQITWRAIPFFVLAGLCTTGLGRMTLYSSIQRIGPSQASAVRNTTPVFTAIFAIFILQEHIAYIPGIGMVLLIGGMMISGYSFFRAQSKNISTEESQVNEKHQQWIGYALALFSAVVFGVGQGFRKQGLLIMDDAFFGAWLGSLTSLLFIIFIQITRGKIIEKIQEVKQEFNFDFFIAGVLTSLGPLFFFLAAMNMQISYVSAIAASEPLITTVVSALFIKNTETITPATWLTVAMIFTGTMLMAIYVT